jgi:putative flavoprotein involved in K+ transport
VIFATGYRPNLAYLAPLNALDAEGRALHRHGVSLTTPGLYFMGLSNQRTFASATLRGVGSDAVVVVRHLTRQLAPATRAFIPARLRLAATRICCPTR